jgi:hypothetical protein
MPLLRVQVSVGGEAEPAGHYAIDRVSRGAVESHAAADDIRILSKFSRPQSMTDDQAEVARTVEDRWKRRSDDRLNARHPKEVVGGDF